MSVKLSVKIERHPWSIPFIIKFTKTKVLHTLNDRLTESNIVIQTDGDGVSWKVFFVFLILSTIITKTQKFGVYTLALSFYFRI